MTLGFSGCIRLRHTFRLFAPPMFAVLALFVVSCDAGRAQQAETDDQKTPKRAKPNRLAHETSPYLLLHAHNPVDWYPWGPEAFEKAKRDNKPIFLSIGYSSCFWCHVMERLVFSNDDIARYMNEHFVNVKVDREERPDLDDIYMTSLIVYLHMIGSRQSGGWPLSMFLTPEGKPIAGGTYFPPDDAQGRMGFPTFMSRVDMAWTKDQEAVLKNADILTREVRRNMKPRLATKTVEPSRELAAAAAKALLETYDAEYGGFGFNPRAPDRPKFPVPAKLALLQYEVRRHGNEKAAKALYDTLDRIANGGIHDHLGGGFHRYSTDRFWHVPHFEKMLYDQVQLADVYVEAYRRTNKPRYRDVAEGIFRYLARDMTDPAGGFFSAIDAETDAVEGLYYVWSPDELETLLGKDDAKLFGRVYGFENPQRFEPGFVLHLPKPLEQIAKDLAMSPAELEQRLAPLRDKLLDARSRREMPARDDKILTGWNGLAIRALAHAGIAFGRDDYVKRAEKTALFLLAEVRDKQGRLHRTWRTKQAKLNAYVDDYAFLVEGLLALYEATGETKWLNAARRLTDDQIASFWDENGNGFFFTPHHHEELIARTKVARDAVLPSGNSVSVRNLIRLASLSEKPKYREHAEQTLRAFAADLESGPRGMANMALAMSEFLDAPDFKATQPRESKTPQTLRPPPRSDGGPLEKSLKESAGDEPEVVQTGGEEPQAKKKKKRKHKVIARAFLSVDKLPAGGKCRIVVFVDVDENWHINTNPAQPKYLRATTFKVKSEQGTQLIDVKYPEGKQVEVPGLKEKQTYYEGRIAIYGELEIPRDVPGRRESLDLLIRYQACNDQTCLRPMTLTLEGKNLPVAAPGEPVKSINGRLFSDR